MDPIYIGGAVVIAAIAFLIWRARTKERTPLPPSPQRVPGERSGSRQGGRR